MHSGRVRVGVLILLALSAFLIPGSASLADVSEIIILPWVPNGDTVGGLGSWYGRIELQNPSASNCIIHLNVGKTTGGWTASTDVVLNAYQLADLSPVSIGLPSPGGAVTISSNGCMAAASVKQASGGFVDPPWSHGTAEVTGYTGIPIEDTIGTPAWILPIVQTNSNWNSYIRVSNVDPTSTTKATVDIFPYQNAGGADGSVFSETVTIAAGATRTIDVHDALAQSGFVGFARISSAGHVAALVQREKPAAQLAMINVASPYPTDLATIQIAGSYALQAPIVFTAYNGWNTGINLANPNDATANVTISYPGAGRPDDVVTMTPYSSNYVYTPGNAANQSGSTGNAVIYSDIPIAAAVDEVKYSTSDSISYIAVPSASDQLSVPIVFKQSQDDTRSDNSGINISNGNDSQTTVEITIYSRIGAVVGGPFDLTIPAHSGNFLYLASAAIPAGTVGSAIVHSIDGAKIVAVSNDVSYDVPGNGSAVFNAPSPAGLYMIGGAPSPQN